MAFNERDILKDAPEWFIEVYTQIENEKNNPKNASNIALNCLKSHSNELFSSIDYEQLLAALNTTTANDLNFWRNIYLIERSISPTFSELSNSWLERIKNNFCNNYIAESFIVNNIRVPKEIRHTNFDHKLRFISGKNRDIDHTKLYAGPGQDEADFYFYDDNIINDIQGVNKKVRRVDAKLITNSLDETVKTYKNKLFGKGSRHNADYIIAYTKDLSKFYFVDYTNTEPKIIEVYPRG